MADTIKIGIKPDYIITIGDFIITPTGGMSGLTVTQPKGSADSADIILDNLKDGTGKRVIDKVFEKDEVKIETSYIGQSRKLLFEGEVESKVPNLSKPSGPMITIHCVTQERDLLGENVVDTKYVQQTMFGITNSIVRESGFTIEIKNPPPQILGALQDEGGDKVYTIDQETKKMAALQKIADEMNYDIIVEPGKKIVFYPKDMGRRDAILVKYGDNLLGGAMDETAPEVTAVRVIGGKANESTRVEYTAKDQEALDAGKAEYTIIIYTSKARDVELAQIYAESLIESYKRQKSGGNIDVPGHPEFKKKGLIDLQDDGTIGINGIFEIDTVVHTITKNEGYKCNLKLVRGASST